MGRAKHQITKDKKDIKTLTKIAAATERAKRQLDRKDAWKDLPVQLKDVLLNALSKLDLVEIAAIVGLTVLIKPNLKTLVVVTEASVNIMFDWWRIWAFPLLGMPQFNYTAEEIKAKIDAGDTDLGYWVMSFVLAFCFIKWGDKLLSFGVSSLKDVVGLLGLGMK